MGLLTNLEREGAYRLPWAWLYSWIEAISLLLDGETGPVSGYGLGASFGLSQATWFVDPINGNDANDGKTSATALKTDARRQVLWGGVIPVAINQPVTVTYLSSLPATDVVSYNVITGTAGKLTVSGTSTVQPAAGSGAFTAVQTINRAGNAVTNVTDGARAWTAGQRIRITASTDPTHVGAVAWITKDLGAGAAETTCFVTYTVGTNGAGTGPTQIATAGNLGPAVGDSYVVETISTIPIGVITANSGGIFAANLNQVFFDQLELDGTNFAVEGYVLSHSSLGPTFTSCKLKAMSIVGGPQSPNGAVGVQAWNCLQDTVTASGVYFAAGGTITGANQLTVLGRSPVAIDKDFLAADKGMANLANGPAVLLVGTAAAMRAPTAITLQPGTFCRQLTINAGANALYGSGNTTGVNCHAAAMYTYVTKPTIATTGNDTVIGGTNTAWAAVPFVNTGNQAEIVLYA